MLLLAKTQFCQLAFVSLTSLTITTIHVLREQRFQLELDSHICFRCKSRDSTIVFQGNPYRCHKLVFLAEENKYACHLASL